jgi:quercetin dioxygenase-like cupin family protein
LELTVTGEHLHAQARRVVTGINAEGRSYVASDDYTPHRLPNPGNTKNDMWRVHSIPVKMTDGDGITDGKVVTEPPVGGLIYRVVSFPPDSEWDRSLGYGDANGRLSTGNPDFDDEGIPGLHVTDTVDFLTVISGELWCELQEGEVHLKAGDTIIQRGTKHSWSNRTDQVTTIVSVMMTAER